jgi:hypothetical protein
MTVTAVSCRRDVDRCGAEDREVHQALNQSLERAGEKRAGKDVTARGPGWDETKKEQGTGAKRLVEKVSGKAVIAKVIEKGLLHAAEKGIAKAGFEVVAHGMSVVGWVKTGVEVTTHVHKATTDTARELGAELHQANLRDAQNVTVLRMAAPKLPKEYVKRELEARSRASDYAKKIETVLQSRPPASYLKLMKSVQQSAQAGIDAAKQRGIDSPTKLAETLKKDADFAKAYDSNTAFRHGVRSTVY